MTKYSCVVVGLGSIGMGYDYNEKDKILTHTCAINSHPGFILVSAVDPSSERRALFESKYCIQSYKCIKDIPLDLNVDIFIVCTPTQFHLASISEIADNFSPLSILCEKPISNSFVEANSFFSIFKNRPK